MSNIKNILTVAAVQAACDQATNGANVILEWVRDCKTRKGVEVSITKHVRMVGRVGIDYDNQKAVIAKRASDELPSKNQGLSWGQWVESSKYLIEHKGNYYVRLYSGTSKKTTPSVQFRVNGQPTTLQAIEPAYFADPVELRDNKKLTTLTASEVKSEKGDCFTCKVADMIRIHTEVNTPEVPQVKTEPETETVNA